MIKYIIKKAFSPFLIILIRTNIRLIRERYILLKNQKKLSKNVAQKENANTPIFIEFGSTTPRKNWITIDVAQGADIILDITCEFPLKSNCVDKIYTSHLLEHFQYKDLIQILNEFYRILKIGGELSICIPDATIYIDAYQRNDEDLKSALNNLGYFDHPFTRIDLLNYIAYMGSVHKYMFEFENIESILNVVGFNKVCKREFEHKMDLEIRRDESIFVLAVK